MTDVRCSEDLSLVWYFSSSNFAFLVFKFKIFNPMNAKLFFLTLLLLSIQQTLLSQKIILEPKPITLKKGMNFDLLIPKGYNISVAAEGLGRLRFMAKSPDGRLFATDMINLEDNKKGKVYVLDNWNETEKRFEKVTTFLDSLHNPNQVGFYSVAGQNFIFIAETHQLSAYIYFNGDMKPSGKQKVLATFPDYGLSYKYGGWHLTRSLAFHNGKVYVSVGSSCNSCVEKEEIRATILEMNPDGTDVNYFAKGLRNCVAIKWVNDKLYATGMGEDLLGQDKPDDPFLQVERGKHYGWPYYYYYKRKAFVKDTFQKYITQFKIPYPPNALGGFVAHSAPLGFDYFKNFNDFALKNSFLVCLHGSTSVWRQHGYEIVKWTKGNYSVPVVSGFLKGKTDKDRVGRPCDILMKDANSFYFTDDYNGVLYYVWK